MLENFLQKNGYDGLEKFDEYRSLLKWWNENRCNLTAITNDAEIEVKHFIDSLYGEKFIKKNATVLDVGSGAGFPGLPLKIVRDDINLTMLDSVNKKVEFLKAVIEKLNLSNVRAIHSRVEDLSKNEKYDVVLSRAVASLRTLLEYTLPFLRVGGIFIAYKSGEVEEELNEAKNALFVLNGKIVKTETFMIENSDIKRTLIIIEKIKETDKKYPRSKNAPRLKPL